MKMIKIKDTWRILVGLDLSAMDSVLLSYVSYLTEIWKIEHIDFVHNIKKTELYDLFEDFVDKSVHLEEIIEQEITRKVKKKYTGSAAYAISVTCETYTESILSYFVKDNQIDLVIFGQKSQLQGTGGMNLKLVNMINCHMMLIPEKAKHKLDSILVPTDFTVNSAKSFQLASHIKKQNNVELKALNVFNIPSMFFPFIDREKAIDETKKHLDTKYEAFTKRHKLEKVPFKHFYRKDLSVVDSIRKYARESKVNMIVMSAKGGNKLTSLFIGSITNDMLLQDFKMPVLIVK